ncbi:hypothetical protein ES708_26366 [subsurface metagenome]
MGVAWPLPRFTVGTGAETGCITDNLTGLMWEQVPLLTDWIWTEALTYANNLDLGGHSDWRLPNRKELRSLVNYEETNTADWLNNPAQGFSPGSVQPEYYWSSTTSAMYPGNAWYVDMSNGGMYISTKTEPYYVLAVRSGQAGSAVSSCTNREPRQGPGNPHPQVSIIPGRIHCSLPRFRQLYNPITLPLGYHILYIPQKVTEHPAANTRKITIPAAAAALKTFFMLFIPLRIPPPQLRRSSQQPWASLLPLGQDRQTGLPDRDIP